MIIEQAKKVDYSKILTILDELDLHILNQSLENFWIGKINEEIIAVAALIDYDYYLFLESVGVSLAFQHQGYGQLFIQQLLDNIVSKNIYLYTIIPQFFTKLGFQELVSVPNGLPSRQHLNCDECLPDQCVCMVLRRHKVA